MAPTARSRPISPLASSRSTTSREWEPRLWKPTWTSRSAAPAASRRRSNWSRLATGGFSSRTSAPIRRAARARSKWVSMGVETTTTSTSGPASSSCARSPNMGTSGPSTPSSSTRRSTAATRRTRPSSSSRRMFARWRPPKPPIPTRQTRTGPSGAVRAAGADTVWVCTGSPGFGGRVRLLEAGGAAGAGRCRPAPAECAGGQLIADSISDIMRSAASSGVERSKSTSSS